MPRPARILIKLRVAVNKGASADSLRTLVAPLETADGRSQARVATQLQRAGLADEARTWLARAVTVSESWAHDLAVAEAAHEARQPDLVEQAIQRARRRETDPAGHLQVLAAAQALGLGLDDPNDAFDRATAAIEDAPERQGAVRAVVPKLLAAGEIDLARQCLSAVRPPPTDIHAALALAGMAAEANLADQTRTWVEAAAWLATTADHHVAVATAELELVDDEDAAGARLAHWGPRLDASDAVSVAIRPFLARGACRAAVEASLEAKLGDHLDDTDPLPLHHDLEALIGSIAETARDPAWAAQWAGHIARACTTEEGRLLVADSAPPSEGTPANPDVREAMTAVLREHMAPETQARWDARSGT